MSLLERALARLDKALESAVAQDALVVKLALGARSPARLIKSLQRAKDDEYVERVGIHWATEQVRDLVDRGVKGVHFYTLNRSKATLTIYETLGLKNISHSPR